MSGIFLPLNHELKGLYCLNHVRERKISQAFLDYFQKKSIPIYFIDHEDEIPDSIEVKENLILTEKKGGFVNFCPCTPKVIRCGYSNINLVEGCPFICNYCALDVYLKNKGIRIFTNLEDFESELDHYLKKHHDVRLGTGELTDSLVLDEIFPYSVYLSEIFKQYPKAVLEFKTKSVNIQRFINGEIQPSKNILISWSVNSSRKIREEETYTPSVEERIRAAEEVSKLGFKVGFHFDPVYYYEGYQNDYKEVIEKIFTTLDDSKIGWISIGVIRFHPDLKNVLAKRNSKILDMELFPSYYDGKMRLFYRLRKEVFQFLSSEIMKYTKKVYLCMEPDFMWDDAFVSYERINSRIYHHFFQ